MKKIYALALSLLAVSFAAQAQSELLGKKTHVARPVMARVQPLVQLDTVFPSSYVKPCFDSSLTYYSYNPDPQTGADQGTVTGTNYLAISEVLMKYQRPSPAAYVVGVQAFIVNVIDNNGVNGIVATYYDARRPAANRPQGYPVNATRQISDTVFLADIARGLTEFSFAGTVLASDSFFVGVEIANGDGDTSTVVQTDPACNSGRILSFRKQLDARGNPVFYSFSERLTNFNPDLVIFPVLDLDVTVATAKNLSAAVNVMPVPARSEVIVSLPKNLAGANAYSLIGMDGKTVLQGTTNGTGLRIERGNLKAGVYSLRIASTAGPIVKRVIFE